jgi:hypothetical protein
MKTWEIFHSEAIPGQQPESWGVSLSLDSDEVATAIFFGTEEHAKQFAALGQGGASQEELSAFCRKHSPFRDIPSADDDPFPF